MEEYWIDSYPKELRAERFMHTLNEIKMLMNKGKETEACPLFEKAKRLCPDSEVPKKDYVFYGFYAGDE